MPSQITDRLRSVISKDPIRDAINRPGIVTWYGRRYAAGTDGNVLAMFPATDDAGETDEFSDRFPDLKFLQDATFVNLGSVSVRQIREWAHVAPVNTYACCTCDATGRTECATCSGLGEHECPDCLTWHNCGTCDGSGRQVCEHCSGAGSCDLPILPAKVTAAGRLVDQRKIARMIATYRGDASDSIAVSASSDGFLIRLDGPDGWIGIVAALRDDADLPPPCDAVLIP